jgi:hypothetical protein
VLISPSIFFVREAHMKILRRLLGIVPLGHTSGVSDSDGLAVKDRIGGMLEVLYY